ncbi:MAG: FliG C-terminal domain-containing protein [Rhodobacter sp.]|nr:FliG C-terminal domain-containing protein [Rhodobacter sp.]
MDAQALSNAPAAPAPVTGPGGATLSRRQKAAIVVRLLRAEGLELSLADLPETLQVALTQDMSAMRYIDRATLDAVVREFVQELDGIGLAFPGDVSTALSVLDGTISNAAADRLRLQLSAGKSADPWERLAALDPPDLLPFLESESIEVGAVLLSKLKVSKSAELLGLLPGERARRIAYAMSRTSGVSPATVARIGAALVKQLDEKTPKAFASDPVDRVGAILNFSPAATRDEVLEGLQTEDAGFAEQVRRAIFTFANIPARVEARDVPKITRDVEAAVLTTALAAAVAREGTDEAAAAEFILSNMSQRMAAQLRDEMQAVGKVRDKEAEAAMNAVISAIRALEAAGEIVLETPED